MNINQEKEGTTLTITLDGRLDTMTAPKLEEVLCTSTDDVEKLILDLEKLEYISSAGLRVILSAQKRMNKQGRMTVRKVKPEIMEIFEVTGFLDILNIEA